MQAFLRYFKGILWFRNNELINRLNKPNNIGIQSKEKHLPNFWLSFYCVAKARIKTAISVNGELFLSLFQGMWKIAVFYNQYFSPKNVKCFKESILRLHFAWIFADLDFFFITYNITFSNSALFILLPLWEKVSRINFFNCF